MFQKEMILVEVRQPMRAHEERHGIRLRRYLRILLASVFAGQDLLSAAI